ncbi:MAG TPA: rhomboid family intramembrane serine protease [Candidatus Bathyarchaeia archaeon]|nr:rhomboid family intramembrane serine protease [Candidatus Bathyarchaeia archaeon]
MIPIRDHNPSGKFPFITYLLIALNLVVFAVMFLASETAVEQLVVTYALIPDIVVTGQNLYTLLTSMFLHGGIAHVFGNMLFLYIFGDNLEDYFGHLQFLFFYLFGGVIAAVLQVMVNPHSTVPVLGASGAIAAIMGGYLVLFPRHRVDVLFIFGWVVREASVPAYTMLFYWFIFQLFSGVGSLAYLGQEVGGVAYFAHIGGFAFGWTATKLARKANR